MKVSFEEIGHLSASFGCAEGKAGQVCRMKANGEVVVCGDGDGFCGVIETVRKDLAGVQLHGFAQVSFTGSAPAVGYAKLAANGKGGVKAGGTREYLVVSVDAEAGTAIIEL